MILAETGKATDHYNYTPAAPYPKYSTAYETFPFIRVHQVYSILSENSPVGANNLMCFLLRTFLDYLLEL